MITLIAGTNRPGSNTRKIARDVEEIYAELKVLLHVLDLVQLPAKIFSPTAYSEKPKSFLPFAEAILKSSVLHVVTPEYNGGIPGVLKNSELLDRLRKKPKVSSTSRSDCDERHCAAHAREPAVATA